MALVGPRVLFRVGRRTPISARVLADVAAVLVAVVCMAAALGFAPVSAANTPGPERDDYLVIYQLEKPYGYVRTTRTTVVENGETLYHYRAEEEQHIKLLDSKEMVVRIEEEAYTDLDFRVRRFSYRRTSGPSELLVEGVVKGGKAHITIDTAGWPVERTVDFPEDMYHLLTLEDLIVSKGLEPEQVCTFKVFDVEKLAPDMAAAVVVGETSLEFDGEKIRASNVLLEVLGFVQMLSLDREGHVYAMDTMGSYIEVRRVPNGKLPKLSAMDLALDLAVFSASAEIEDLDDLRSMTVKVDVPMVFCDYIYPEDARQEAHGEPDASGESLTITIKTASQTAPSGPTVKIPVEPGEELGPYLAEELDELHTHPLVQRCAAEAVGGETDAWAAFLKIVDWVNAHIPDDDEPYLATVPEALSPGGVFGLGAREKVIVALAKAAGIPIARAVGYMYVKGAFVGLSWLEVWAGKWIPVDVNADNLLVTPAYIKIADAPYGAQIDPLYGILRSSSMTLEQYETSAGVETREKSSFILDGVYVNARQRYQVELPLRDGWEIHEELGGLNGPMVVITPPGAGLSRIAILVLPVDAPDESGTPDDVKVHLGEVAEGMSRLLGDLHEGYKENGIEWRDFMGHTASVLSCEYEIYSTKHNAEYYVFIVDDRMFLIEVSGPAEEFPKLKEDFRIFMDGLYIAR